MIAKIMLLIRARSALRHARKAGLPGLDFDAYGRRLARRELAGSRRFGRFLSSYLNPVSCVRYFEFPFAQQALARHFEEGTARSVLDVSSPRLLPFWLAECAGHDITMINPDAPDLARSEALAQHARVSGRLHFSPHGDATSLPFPDNSFDCVTCISVIEHISGSGDKQALREFTRVVRPGGAIVLTFPVKPTREDEFRQQPCYTTQQQDPDGRGYFFQRFYDDKDIQNLIKIPALKETERRYFVESPPGWFQAYELQWIQKGLAVTARDPHLMADHFSDVGPVHPRDRTGVVGLHLTVE